VIHLDTSFLIRALARGSPEDQRLRLWLRVREPLGISAIGWAEFLCGPVEPGHAELAARIVSRRFAFEEEDAVLAARLFNESGRRRGSLTDCMIAATAIRAEARLATVNLGDFRRFEAAGLETITT
jgi:predicted nucleic acid-binding protein